MKFARPALWGAPWEIDRLLNEPIRANKIPDGEERWKAIKEQTQAREEALFAKYHIPAEWDELLQWRELALCLAGELYPGCRTIERGLGGPMKVKRIATLERKQELLRKFTDYRAQRGSLSATRAAEFFLKDQETECAAVKLRTVRTFLKAMRELPQES